MTRLPTIGLGHAFTHLPEHVRQDIDTLSRECAVYTDHWIEEVEDFRHVRIAFTNDERAEYGRRAWAFELFLRAGSPARATDAPGIDQQVAAEADAYELVTKSGEVIRAGHSFASFLGPHLEALVCSRTERQVVIDLQGREALLFNTVRTIETLTPTIRSFNNRESGLAPWSITCEDDVRDLLYVMLRPSIFDLVKEEPVPSRAGTHKFVDLCSKATGLFIELKWISRRGQWKKIIEQTHVDVQSYIAHPACRTLLFVIVDAVRDIPDPHLVESELTTRQAIGDRLVDVRTIVQEP